MSGTLLSQPLPCCRVPMTTTITVPADRCKVIHRCGEGVDAADGTYTDTTNVELKGSSVLVEVRELLPSGEGVVCCNKVIQKCDLETVDVGGCCGGAVGKRNQQQQERLRFEVGDVVMAKVDQWRCGLIIATHDAKRVYRIRIFDDGAEVWAPEDTDTYITSAPKDAVERHLNSKEQPKALTKHTCMISGDDDEIATEPFNLESHPDPEIRCFLSTIPDVVASVQGVAHRLEELYTVSTVTFGKAFHDAVWRPISKPKITPPPSCNAKMTSDAININKQEAMVDMMLLESLLDGTSWILRAVDDCFSSSASKPIASSVGVALQIVRKTIGSGITMSATKVAQSLCRAVCGSVPDRSFRALCVALQLPLHIWMTPCELVQPLRQTPYATAISTLMIMRMMEIGFRERVMRLPATHMKRLREAVRLQQQCRVPSDRSLNDDSNTDMDSMLRAVSDLLFTFEASRRQLWHCFSGGMCVARYPSGRPLSHVAGGWGYITFRIHNAPRMLLDERMFMSPEFDFGGHRWVLVSKRMDPSNSEGGSGGSATEHPRLGFFLRCRCVGCCRLACAFSVKIVNHADRDNSIDFSTEHVFEASNPDTQQWGNDVMTMEEAFHSESGFLLGGASTGDIFVEIRIKLLQESCINKLPAKTTATTTTAKQAAHPMLRSDKRPVLHEQVSQTKLLEEIERTERIKQIRSEMTSLAKREATQRESIRAAYLQRIKELQMQAAKEWEALEKREKKHREREAAARAREEQEQAARNELVARLMDMESEYESLLEDLDHMSAEVAEARGLREKLEAEVATIANDCESLRDNIRSQAGDILEMRSQLQPLKMSSGSFIESHRDDTPLEDALDSFLDALEDQLKWLQLHDDSCTNDDEDIDDGDALLSLLQKSLASMYRSSITEQDVACQTD